MRTSLRKLAGKKSAAAGLLCLGAAVGFSACGKQAVYSHDLTSAALSRKDVRSKAHAEAGKVPYGQNPADYVLTFSDEFDHLDRSLWNDHMWFEQPNPTINYAVEGGKLKIWPQRDASQQFFNRTLDTDGRFYQSYGYFEMEAKLPRGKGAWPAFWLFNHLGERRPEIDIMEAYPGGIHPWGYTDSKGVSRPTGYGVTVWQDEGVKRGQLQYDAKRDLSERFHKYAVKWEPHKQTFFFDGKKVYEAKVHMSDPKYLVLDLWFGSSSGTPDDSTPQGKNNAFEINYVRVWQFKQTPELRPVAPEMKRVESAVAH